MDRRSRSRNVARVFYAYLKGVKLGRLTLCTAKIAREDVRLLNVSREFHGAFLRVRKWNICSRVEMYVRNALYKRRS